MGKKNKKCKCKCEGNVRYSIILKDDDNSVAYTAFKDSDHSFNDATWCELLYRFRMLLLSQGYVWTDEIEELWRNLINCGIDEDQY
jgi:hypothetical protein